MLFALPNQVFVFVSPFFTLPGPFDTITTIGAMLRKTELIFLICLFALAGCGNNPYPPESGALRLYTALTEDPRTLDPAQVSDTTSAEVLTQIYDALYQNAYLDRPYHVEPALADGHPE